MAEDLGEIAANLVQSPQHLTNTLNGSRDKLAMTTRYATLLLGCYRTGEANDPEVYTAAIIRVMSAYSEDILRRITDPLTGIPSKIEWLPKPAEVLRACEELAIPERRAREWEARTLVQLAERAELEAGPRQVPQHILDELAANGLLKNAPKRATVEDASAVMTRLGVTKEQWDAVPDGKPVPPDTEWPKRL